MTQPCWSCCPAASCFVVVLLAKTVRIVPQARAGIVERFGKYKETLPAGPQHRGAVRRQGALPHRPARAGRVASRRSR